MRHAIISILLVAVFGLSFVPKAEGYPVTIQIEAVVYIVEDSGNYLGGKVHVNDIITGGYTYESTTEDTNPSSQVGDYWHYFSPAGVFLTVGGFNFQTDPANVKFIVEIVNNNAGIDGYLFRSYNNLPLSNGTLVDTIDWQLQDSTMTVLSSDELPVTEPALAAWQDNHLHIDGERARYVIDAHVTSAVPEPATILLLSLGAFYLKKRG